MYRHTELLETDHAAVECHAEDGNHKETRIAQDLPYIREPELVLFRSLHLVRCTGLPVKTRIHSHEDCPQNRSDSKHGKSYECRSVGLGKSVHFSQSLLFYNHWSHKYRRSRTETRYRKLKSHSECHVPALEPFGDGPCHRHTCNLTPKTEKHAADIGNRQRHRRLESRRNGKCHKAGTEDHHSHEYASHQSHTELVKQSSAYYQATPYAQERISAGIESVVRHIPAKLQILGILEKLRQRREHVVEKV